MRAGQLRHRGDIEQPSPVTEATLGQPVPTWSTFARGVWAAIEPVTGTERFVSQELLATASHVIKIRYFDGVNSSMRFKYGARIFQFQSVIDKGERRRELLIAATEEAIPRG